MVVYVYENISKKVNDFVIPTLYSKDGFNILNYITKGYFVLLPDIEYEIGNPGISALVSVENAVKKAVPEIAITERCERPWFNAADCGSGTDSFRMSRQASAVPHPSPRKNSWFGPVLRICGVANPRPQWQPLPEQVQQ